MNVELYIDGQITQIKVKLNDNKFINNKDNITLLNKINDSMLLVDEKPNEYIYEYELDFTIFRDIQSIII